MSATEKNALTLTVLTDPDDLSGKAMMIYDESTGEAYGASATAMLGLDYATASTLVGLPVDKSEVIVTIAAAETISYITTPAAHFKQKLLVKNSTAAEIVQAIPNSGAWVAVNGASVTIPANGAVEINVWYIDSKYRVRI